MPGNKRLHAKRAPTRTSWKKGISGNPRGRPTTDPEFKAAVLQRTAEAVATLVELMRHSPKDDVREGAAKWFLEQGHGKAALSVDVTSKGEKIEAAVPQVMIWGDTEIKF